MNLENFNKKYPLLVNQPLENLIQFDKTYMGKKLIIKVRYKANFSHELKNDLEALLKLTVQKY